MNDLPDVLIPTQRTAHEVVGRLPSAKYGVPPSPVPGIMLSPYGRPGHRPVRILYDCEFLEDGRIIDLISIGMVACAFNPHAGRYLPVAEFYAVNADAPWVMASVHPFVSEHVLPSLPGQWDQGASPTDRLWVPDRTDPLMQTVEEIAPQVEAIVTAGGEDVELWAWYGAYDHVALCQLWGAMIDKPAGVPMYTHDLQQEADRQGVRLAEQPSGEHNALEDARYNVVRAHALGVIW